MNRAGGTGPKLAGWDDPKAPRGPEAACPACPMKVGTRIWQGHLCLNPHAHGGYAPRGEWCPMSKGALLHYRPSQHQGQ